jgi:hypothetical protein
VLSSIEFLVDTCGTRWPEKATVNEEAMPMEDAAMTESAATKQFMSAVVRHFDAPAVRRFDAAVRRALIRNAERDAIINQTRVHGTRGALGLKRLDSFYGGLLLAPTFACPADLTKSISTSVQFDGGKWLCGLSLVGRHARPPCLLYSLGSNFDTSFESFVQAHARHPCDVEIYDPTLANHPPKRVKAFRASMATRRGRWRLHEVLAVATAHTQGTHSHCMACHCALCLTGDSCTVCAAPGRSRRSHERRPCQRLLRA